ncbi:helix-turn-helix domain-containing protein [Thermomonospora umbrina]|uniref:Helix-turn-helix protein n=1 Tax=Thermomonospora umbrina TaxID=111806 RepID=A0A3D9T6L5_9ACTN|nr:helix-turn-helix transcriptional regulator [Thermomonospora umbrina]REF00305.1 helix-turn-helix protein [Thermomonospora umbrina]
MPDPLSPTARLRTLSLELARLREAAGLTRSEAAKAAGWTPNKVTRIEAREWRQPKLLDVEVLLDVYGVTDPDRRAELLRLAREARQRGWWTGYRASQGYQTYIGLEAEAAVIRTWEQGFLPGLLRTPQYSRALVAARDPELPPETVADLVALTEERQHTLLNRPRPTAVWAILDESVLHRTVGDTATMVEQITHLHKVAQVDHVTVQVLPLAVGAHPGIDGGFTIITFRRSVTDPEIAFTETPAGEFWIEDADGVDRMIRRFGRLKEAALSRSASLSLIAARLADLHRRT